MNSISISQFFAYMAQYPSLIITSVLTIAVIFVNGWTDAPNAIATCVSTRAISPRKAILMAAIFNFAGLFLMTMVNASVAETITHMVDFGNNTQEAMIALCAAMIAIVLWASLASVFGIPTSESHALIAGLSGAAIAMHNSLDGISLKEWGKVLFGLFFSTILGFILGFIVTRIIEALFKNTDRQKSNRFFKKAEIFSGASMAFMHGAQDGQKFLGVFLLGLSLAMGQSEMGATAIPLWLMLLCAAVMGIGTSIGGMKIIKSVGMDMVKLSYYQGFSADVVSSFNILLSTIFGLPVSTTHVKTSAIMGVGASKGKRNVNWSVVKEMVMTWILTFPGCGLIAFVFTKLFLLIG